ncbi:hypothetical protein Acr_29g0003370 [Actinidia rufa]|uniref:Uncharacterized protein n=1 Tax=Actinidia rufa TaxID=165716 RepID=A0A7J0HDW6_9ERIC|nr:hypothetical protein Acr_29g0003370 [Actinidia rufa]
MYACSIGDAEVDATAKESSDNMPEYCIWLLASLLRVHVLKFQSILWFGSNFWLWGGGRGVVASASSCGCCYGSGSVLKFIATAAEVATVGI